MSFSFNLYGLELIFFLFMSDIYDNYDNYLDALICEFRPKKPDDTYILSVFF